MANETAVDILIRLGLLGADKAEEAKAAIRGLTEQTHEAGKETEKLEINHHALHQILRLIGHETAPEVGHALGAMMLGPTGAVLAFGLIFTAVFEHFKKESEKAAEELKSQWETQRKSLEDSRLETIKFADELRKASQDANPLKTRLDDAQKAIENMVKAMHEYLDAQEQADIAAAKGNEAAITAIKERYEQTKKQYDLESELAKMKEMEGYLGANRDPFERDMDVKRAKQRVDALTGDATIPLIQADIKAGEASTKVFEAMRAIKEEFGSADSARALARSPMMATTKLVHDAQYNKDVEIDLPKEQVDKAVEFNEQRRKAIILLSEGVEELEKNKEALKKHTESLEKANQDLTEKRRVQTEAESTVKSTDQALKNMRGGIAGQIAGTEISNAQALADKAAAGVQLAQGEQEVLRTVGTMVAGSNVTAQTAARMFEAAKHIDAVNHNNNAIHGFLERIIARLEGLKSNELGTLDARLRNLELHRGL